jgi:predicted ATPase
MDSLHPQGQARLLEFFHEALHKGVKVIEVIHLA